MNCNPTLTADEFKTIHNALCSLDYLNNDKVSELVETIRGALANAYEQDHKAFDSKMEYYSTVREDLGLNAIWSIYEVADLNERHPYEGAKYVSYKDHWGNGIVTQAINGSTYAALYVAANACIRDSGDEHHIFIEDFRKSGDTLLLTTGS